VAQLLLEKFVVAIRHHGQFDSKGHVRWESLSAINTSSEMAEAALLAGQLQLVDVEQLSHEQKLAFFINAFNALVLHGHVRRRPVFNSGQTTHWVEVGRFFRDVRYAIGGHILSPIDIEHSILRAWSSRPSKSLVQQFIDTPKFAPDDIRKVCRLQRAEVDVSFALCVGGISSPELCIFSSEAIMEQLGSAAGKYCDDNVEVNSLQGVVTLPQQFEWYSADFGGTDAKLLSFVCRQLSGSKQKALLSLSQTSARLGKVLVIQYREFRFDFSYSVQAVDLKSSVSSPEKDSDWEPLTQQGPALGTHMSMSAPSHSRSLAETQSAPYRL